MNTVKLDQAAFLKKYSITDEEFAKAKLEWGLLEQIYADYTESRPNLVPLLDFLLAELRTCNRVHSVRGRLKDPEHLLEKIIRKRAEKLEKGVDFDVDVSNYPTKVPDLLGLRAIHLFKEDWLGIDDYIRKQWDLVEEPTANIREGDSKEVQEQFRARGCEIRVHPAGYRSVHYLIKQSHKKKDTPAEIQVRTIFEEGWSEIDHAVRYPYGASPILEQYLVLFNRLAGSSDEMGSFVRVLQAYMASLEREHQRKTETYEQTIAELRKTIERLKIDVEAKEDLQRRVDSLKSLASSEWPSGGPSVIHLSAHGLWPDEPDFVYLEKLFGGARLRDATAPRDYRDALEAALRGKRPAKKNSSKKK